MVVLIALEMFASTVHARQCLYKSRHKLKGNLPAGFIRMKVEGTQNASILTGEEGIIVAFASQSRAEAKSGLFGAARE